MTQIIFNTAQATNPDRYGMDIIFYYQIDGQLERSIHAVSSKLWFNFNEQEYRNHAQSMFSGVLEYMKRHKDIYKDLPTNGTIIHETQQFKIIESIRTTWLGYQLNLD